MSINIEEEYDKIFHYCYYRIRNRQAAEDVTQEVFLHFFKCNYVEQEKGIRYLYVIARNLCIDESRKKKLYEIKQEDEVTDEGLLLSELFQNVIPTIVIPCVLLLISLMLNQPIFSFDRKLSQIWQFLPLQRVSKVMLYDERMVQIGNHLFSAIKISIGLYLLISILGLGLCGLLTYVRRKDRR